MVLAGQRNLFNEKIEIPGVKLSCRFGMLTTWATGPLWWKGVQDKINDTKKQ